MPYSGFDGKCDEAWNSIQDGGDPVGDMESGVPTCLEILVEGESMVPKKLVHDRADVGRRQRSETS